MLFADKEIKKILGEAKTIAIIGAKDKPSQPVDRVGRYLLAKGYTVYPVHPKREQVWGLTAYKDVGSLPVLPDVVVLFRAAEYCAGHAHEVLALPGKIKLFWMQLGIACPESMRLMREAGISAVQDACIMVEHKRLFGE